MSPVVEVEGRGSEEVVPGETPGETVEVGCGVHTDETRSRGSFPESPVSQRPVVRQGGGATVPRAVGRQGSRKVPSVCPRIHRGTRHRQR